MKIISSKQGKIYEIPEASYGFDFQIQEPSGAEFIKVQALTAETVITHTVDFFFTEALDN